MGEGQAHETTLSQFVHSEDKATTSITRELDREQIKGLLRSFVTTSKVASEPIKKMWAFTSFRSGPVRDFFRGWFIEPLIGRAKRAQHWGVQSRFRVIYIIIGRAKRAPHWGVQSRFRVIYIYMCVCRMSNHVESRESNTRMLKVSIGRWNPTSDTRIIHFDYTLEQL